MVCQVKVLTTPGRSSFSVSSKHKPRPLPPLGYKQGGSWSRETPSRNFESSRGKEAVALRARSPGPKATTLTPSWACVSRPKSPRPETQFPDVKASSSAAARAQALRGRGLEAGAPSPRPGVASATAEGRPRRGRGLVAALQSPRPARTSPRAGQRVT